MCTHTFVLLHPHMFVPHSHFDFRLGNIMVTGSTKEDWVNADKAQFKVGRSVQEDV